MVRKMTAKEMYDAEQKYIADFLAKNRMPSTEGLIVHHEGESRQVRRNRERIERKHLKKLKREYERRMEIKALFPESTKQTGGSE